MQRLVCIQPKMREQCKISLYKRSCRKFTLYSLIFIFLLFLLLAFRDMESLKKMISGHTEDNHRNILQDSLKYILLWTDPRQSPFVDLKEGQRIFLEKQCPNTNCYVTSNRSLLQDYTKFDVIAFNGPQIIQGFDQFPRRRSLHQKYVFVSIESSDRYPVCTKEFDKFFNWTWTYKLNSDAQLGYLVVRDQNDVVIGPNKDINWMNLKNMHAINETVKKKITYKSKAVAWFVSDCVTQSRREVFAGLLHQSLLEYGLIIDIFGGCGRHKCPNRDMELCLELIKNDYHFYLAFENALSEDYVTDIVLHALNHLAVPVVFGGANYSRFMPDGIYLNAKELGPGLLAQKMYELIKDPDKYEHYFRWHNHYKYYRRIESLETDDYCRFCSMLNDEELVNKTTVYQDFKAWWTPPGKC